MNSNSYNAHVSAFVCCLEVGSTWVKAPLQCTPAVYRARACDLGTGVWLEVMIAKRDCCVLPQPFFLSSPRQARSYSIYFAGGSVRHEAGGSVHTQPLCAL